MLQQVQTSKKWHEQDDIIYLSVTSDGTTGSQWIERLENKGFRLTEYDKRVLCLSDFEPTNGVTHEVAILKNVLFEDDDLIMKKIRAEADKRKLIAPNAEVACLIRDGFSDEEIEAMGLTWIFIMHDPIGDYGSGNLLTVGRGADGHRLMAFSGSPDGRGDRDSGFAFAVSVSQK